MALKSLEEDAPGSKRRPDATKMMHFLPNHLLSFLILPFLDTNLDEIL